MRDKREYLMQAHPFDSKHLNSGCWFASEKLDGMRMFWDGGVSRRVPASMVPWANTTKDYRLKDEVIATGLWSRYGKVIRAPDWWLDMLPVGILLDGEAYLGRGQFQNLVSITKSHDGSDWQDVKFMVFERPTWHMFLMEGRCENANMKLMFKPEFIKSPMVLGAYASEPINTFRSNLIWMRRQGFWNNVVQLHNQIEMPVQASKISEVAGLFAAEIVRDGGEGVMLRSGDSIWTPRRSHSLMKVKPTQDSEATVIGYVSGVEGKEGRRLGKLGSLILTWDNPNGKRVTFNLSGFTDEEIDFQDDNIEHWCKLHPDTELPYDLENFQHPKFPIGSKVTFTYRELTDEGKPKEARYWRKYEHV